MLLSIDFQGTDLVAKNGDLAADSEASLFASDSDTPVAGFAELLKQPVLVGDPTLPLATGELLPEGGNTLPSGVAESVQVSPQIKKPVVHIGGIPAAAASLDPLSKPELGLDSALTKPTPATVPIPAPLSPALLPSALEIKNATLKTETSKSNLQSLLAKAPSRETLRDALRTLPPRQIQTDRRALAANGPQQNEPNVRLAASFDSESVKGPGVPLSGSSASLAELSERLTRRASPQVAVDKPTPMLDRDAVQAIRAPLAGISADQFTRAIERMQMSLPGQSTGTTALSIAPASPLTLAGTTPLATPLAPPLPAPISTPVQDAAWGDVLNSRVLIMTGQGAQSAQIRLNPAELGPVTINVALDDGAADVTFVAQHAVTREAIEMALPRLRELLSENGLLLGNTNVSEQGVEKEGKGGEALAAREQGDRSDEETGEEEVVLAAPARIGQGLVDTFV